MAHPILTIRHHSYAHLLANYLTSQGHPAVVQGPDQNGDATTADSKAYQVCLQDLNNIEEVKAICDAFLQQPNHPRYQQAAWQTGEQVTMPASSGRSAATLLHRAKQAPFTTVVLLLCSVSYALSLLGLFPELYYSLTMQPLSTLAANHQWWRLVGPVFLHFSALHFIFNLLWWSMLGAQIERTLGIFVLLLVFIESAVASNIGQLLVSGPSFGGLSGVVYAVLGFVWWLGWLRPQWGLGLSNSIVGFMLVWLVLGYTDVLWVNMANTAHTVGLISGCALAAIMALGSRRHQHVA